LSATEPPDESRPPEEPTGPDEGAQPPEPERPAGLTPPPEPPPPEAPLPEPTQPQPAPPDETAATEPVPAQAEAPAIEPPRSHPARLVDEDNRKRSRLTVLVRLLLVFPHLIWLSLYTVVAIPVVIFNWFATLIRGRSPERVHRWLVRYLRYTVYVYSYLYLLGNPYPPFHGEPKCYPVDFVLEGPDTQHRLVTLFRVILAIPAFVLNWVFSRVLQIVALLGWLVAIFIGRMPNGMDKLGLYCLRYQLQTTAYLAILTDRYPSLTA